MNRKLAFLHDIDRKVILTLLLITIILRKVKKGINEIKIFRKGKFLA